MSNAHTLTITLDAATYTTLRDFAVQMSYGVEETAAALLTAELVHCTEVEHGADRAGQIFTRGELLHIDLVAERKRSSSLQAELDQVRREVRTVAEVLAKLAGE